ncbi:TF29 protein, partial [Rhadina sibilatrix]|nr:TF29 protein [Rhadina sibilatrix]
YIDDVLTGGNQKEEVRTTQSDIITHLEDLGLEIPPEEIQTISREVSFLEIWWKGGMTCIPKDTPSSSEQVKMPETNKELQQALGMLIFCRKHILDFSIIAHPLFHLLRKGKCWEWTPLHEEALQLLVLEAANHQALGPTHSSDP